MFGIKSVAATAHELRKKIISRWLTGSQPRQYFSPLIDLGDLKLTTFDPDCRVHQNSPFWKNSVLQAEILLPADEFAEDLCKNLQEFLGTGFAIKIGRSVLSQRAPCFILVISKVLLAPTDSAIPPDWIVYYKCRQPDHLMWAGIWLAIALLGLLIYLRR